MSASVLTVSGSHTYRRYVADGEKSALEPSRRKRNEGGREGGSGRAPRVFSLLIEQKVRTYK